MDIREEQAASGAVVPPRSQPLVPNAIHLVRTMQQIHVQLSAMADQKASMLMGAAVVVFTLALGQLRAGAFLLPFVILAVTAFVSATFALLTVTPRVTSIQGPVGPNANFLFFGIFTAMDEQEFADRVIDRLDDDEKLYRTMLRDIHQNGQVLQHRKYRYLSYAYRTFLTGLLLTAVAFAVEFAMGRL